MDCQFSNFHQSLIYQLHKAKPSIKSYVIEIDSYESRIWRLSTPQEKAIMKEKYWTSTNTNTSNSDLIDSWILLDSIWRKEKFDYNMLDNNIPPTYMIEFRGSSASDWKRDYKLYQPNWKMPLAIGSPVECCVLGWNRDSPYDTEKWHLSTVKEINHKHKKFLIQTNDDKSDVWFSFDSEKLAPSFTHLGDMDW